MQTKSISGQTAYAVSAGGAIPDLQGNAPDQADIERGMKRIEFGTHGTGLPSQAKNICPNGYKVAECGEPNVRPEGQGVWSIQAYFSIICA
ncbi:hypothetical protein RA27_22730 [Ruegeria sp. ANG-R]|nr:hypothetical protein RA27_22730 [Ruegeria sp. ANG-R]